MWADKNYEGCADQMYNAMRLSPTAAQSEEARWYLALASVGMDDDAAMYLVTKWIEDFPGSPRMPEAKMLVGDIYFESADYRKAIEAYDKVDAKALSATKQALLSYRQAYSELMLGNYEKAERMFDALKTSPELGSAARFYIGYIAYAQKEYDRAADMLSQVDTSQAPGNAAPYYLAQIYYLQGDNQKALSEARKAIASDLVPEFNAESKRIAGEALYAMGDTDAAVDYLWDYAANTQSPEPSAYYILGMSEWNKGDWRSAGKLFQQATGADNAVGQSSWLYLGQAYLKDNNTNSALMAFEKAFKMDHDPKVSETAFYNYAIAKSNGGRAPFESSSEIFMEFLDRYPNSRYRPVVEKYVIDGYLNNNQPAAALDVISKIKQPDANTLAAKKRALLALGVTQSQAGEHKSALDYFKQARAITQGDASLNRQVILWEGDTYSVLGQTDNAAECYQRFVELAPQNDPNRPLALYDLAYILYGNKKYDEAGKRFTEAINSGALNNRLGADARNRMGDVLYYNKKYSAAASQYKRAAELTPEAADYSLYQAAVMRGLSGDLKGEIADLDAMIKKFPNSSYVADAMLEKAEALSTTGAQKQADAVYSDIMARYPMTAQGRQAAIISAIDKRTAGDTDSAIAAYKKVITDYPASEEARVAAEDLKGMMADAGQLDKYVAFMKSVPGAPEVEMSDIDRSAFRAAEKRMLESNDVTAIAAYVEKFPGGAYEADALYYLADNAQEKGNTEEAAKYAKKIVDTYPKSSVAEDAMVILAKGQFNGDNPAEALAVFRKLEQAASTPANLLTARMGLMTTSLRTDDNATVVATADKVLASSNVSNSVINETRFMKGLALQRLGKKSEAEAIWTQAAATPGDLNGAKSAVYLSQSILDRGDAKTAEKKINKFIDANAPHPYWVARAFIVLSDALRAQGKKFEADQYLTTLKANYPGQQPDIFLMIDERLQKSEQADKTTGKSAK